MDSMSVETARRVSGVRTTNTAISGHIKRSTYDATTFWRKPTVFRGERSFSVRRRQDDLSCRTQRLKFFFGVCNASLTAACYSRKERDLPIFLFCFRSCARDLLTSSRLAG
ncbi:hypothetical protein M404DRAFT_384922 [Pisolithus tinctorius Marx 270]|uniref:Uncharacterized protein n=1 Tax=Pisolithus tinctorius Marx 270 TaxID=870435 RepID=A0A0C3MZT6_PISTI|nr:hypothetical protein M404DRAFT_384922 [Pisolithus tinctorius Marx 270]